MYQNISPTKKLIQKCWPQHFLQNNFLSSKKETFLFLLNLCKKFISKSDIDFQIPLLLDFQLHIPQSRERAMKFLPNLSI